MICYHCIVCHAEIPKLETTADPDWTTMWGNGVVDKISVQYGSKFDGDMYVVAICDDCLKQKLNQGVIRYAGTYLM